MILRFGHDSTMATKGEKRSIHIAVGRFDSWAPAEAPQSRNDVYDDAKAMLELCANEGFTATPMRDPTIAKVEAAFAAATKLPAGSLLVVTFAGHGTQRPQIPCAGTYEPTGNDQAWCLRDGLLRDNDLRRLLAAFPAEIRILIISDACRAGTLLGALDEELQGVIATLYTKELAAVAFQEADRRAAANAESDAAPAARAPLGIHAPVIHFGAAGDRSLALPRNFTPAIVAAWAKGAFKGTHADFGCAVAGRMHSRQVPEMTKDGDEVAAFMNQRPFTL